jgi:LuxR family transcriptional regulator
MLDYVERVIACRDMAELWSHHQTAMRKFGFEKLLYGFTSYRTATSLGDPHDLLVLSNHNSSYIRPFIDAGMYFHAPMVKWALENVGACSWSYVETLARSGGLTERERKVVEFNLSQGIKAGYTVSFQNLSSRSKGAIALGCAAGTTQAEADAIWKMHGRIITAMNEVAHLKLTTLPHTGARRSLTTRQREVLEWVGDGKTTQDIAQILGLTITTIEKHLRLARETLNVDTTAQAVLKASSQNQIFMIAG